MKRYVKSAKSDNNISEYLSGKDIEALKFYLENGLEIYVEEFVEFNEPIPDKVELMENLFILDGPIPDVFDDRLIESVYDMYFDYPEVKNFMNNLIDDTIDQLKRELS